MATIFIIAPTRSAFEYHANTPPVSLVPSQQAGKLEQVSAFAYASTGYQLIDAGSQFQRTASGALAYPYHSTWTNAFAMRNNGGTVTATP
jgi:hypothetical protein